MAGLQEEEQVSSAQSEHQSEQHAPEDSPREEAEGGEEVAAMCCPASAIDLIASVTAARWLLMVCLCLTPVLL